MVHADFFDFEGAEIKVQGTDDWILDLLSATHLDNRSCWIKNQNWCEFPV